MALQLRNYIEEYVLSRLDYYLAELNCCKCEICRYDIAAIVLNELPSKYIVTRVGEFYAKTEVLQAQYEIDLIAKITKAAEIVSAHPRHNSDRD